MGNTLQNPGGWDTGDTITGPQLNGLDAGQARAWVNDGSTSLAAAATVDGGAAYALTLQNLVSLLASAVNGVTIQVTDPAGTLHLTAPSIALSGAVALSQLPTLTSPLVVTRHAAAVVYGVYGHGHGIDTTSATGINSDCAWQLGPVGNLVLGVNTSHRIAMLRLAGLPVGMTVTSVDIELLGSGAALPSTMPSANLYLTPGNTLLGSANDTSATFAVYDDYHFLTIVPSSTLLVQAGKTYYVQIDTGTASQAMSVNGVYVSGTFPSLQFF